MTEAVRRLEAAISSYGTDRAVVAFSGGVDSSVVLAMAARVLGPDRVTGVTALSPSYPAGELEAAREVAALLAVAHRTVDTAEVQREAYARNDAWRCFHCKTELYATVERLVAAARPDTAVLAGANADDADDFRPGLLAARRFGVHNPLLEEGMGKAEVRGVARYLGLPVADKPAMACLSSRVAFGVPITPGLLGRIDQAERAVRGLGFEQVRVRHFGDRASVEVERPGALLAHPGWPALAAWLRAMGWSRVEADPDGYRSGRMNDTLPKGGRVRRLPLTPLRRT